MRNRHVAGEAFLPDQAAARHAERLENIACGYLRERKAGEFLDDHAQPHVALPGVPVPRSRVTVEHELPTVGPPVGQSRRVAQHHAGGNLPAPRIIQVGVGKYRASGRSRSSVPCSTSRIAM